MIWLRRLFPVLFAMLVFSGCAAKMAYKRGLEWETQGEMYRAGKEFVASLNRKSANPEVLAALKRVAEPGYEEGLNLASVAQDNENFPKALSYYQELKTYTKGLSRHNVLTFDIIDIDRYIEDMAVAAATERYNRGTRALNQRNYKQAIDEFKAALRFKKGFRDANQLIARSHYEWAENLLVERKYKVAADRFVKAHNALKGGYRDAMDRAASVYFTIGQFYVEREFCQAGWKELKEARKLVNTPIIQAANARAKACAIRDVGVVVLADGSRNSNAGVHVENIFGERLAAEGVVAAESEKYATVTGVDLRARDIRAGRNVFSVAAARKFERIVIPRVFGVDIARSGWTTNNRQAPAKMWDRCPEGPGLCEKDVTVAYKEHSRTVNLTLRGDVTMLKAPNGNEDWRYEYSSVGTEKVMYADTFMVDEIAVTVGTNKALGVVVLDKTIRSLANGSRKAKVGELSRQVIERIVRDKAKTMVDKAAYEGKPPGLPPLQMLSVR